MDKYNIVLDLIEHPERYTDDRINEFLSDPETKEIYDLLCKTETAIKMQATPDVDAEWRKFSRRNFVKIHKPRIWLKGSRAASIAVIAGASMLAVAAGIAVTTMIANECGNESIQDKDTTIVVPSVIIDRDTIVVKRDSLENPGEIIMFDDSSLRAIMETVAKTYGVEVSFDNEMTAELHLYFKLDPTMTLDEIISQLNTFEQITIRRNGNKLTVE